MSKISNAENCLHDHIPYEIAKEGFSFGDIHEDIILEAMRDFAKIHVQNALKAAANKATAKIETEYNDQPSNSMPPSDYAIVNKKSILSSYPLTKIV